MSDQPRAANDVKENDVIEVPTGLVVGSMCHCDWPDECDDHWSFFVRAEMSADGEHVRMGGTLDQAEMRAIVALVREHNGEEPQPAAIGAIKFPRVNL